MNAMPLIIEKLAGESDPVFRLLKTKFKITPISAYVLLSVVPLVSESIFCYFNDCLFTRSHYIGMWNEYLNFINFFLFFPVVFTLYIWLPTGITVIFQSFQANDIISPTRDNKISILKFENYKTSLLRNKLWFYLVAIAAITANFTLIFPGTNMFQVWWNEHTFTFLSHHMIHIFVLYFIFFSIIRILQLILMLRFFFNNVTIDIKALHPDGCGGLRTLGSFSVKLGYVLGAVGTSMIFVIYFQSYLLGGELGILIWAPSILIFIIAYSICAPVTFFAPLGTAHKAMRLAKEKELLMVSRQFELDYKNMMGLLPKRTNDIKKELEKIEQLKRLYKIIQDFPVWPFNYQNILRFGASVIGPFFFSVLPFILNFFVR